MLMMEIFGISHCFDLNLNIVFYFFLSLNGISFDASIKLIMQAFLTSFLRIQSNSLFIILLFVFISFSPHSFRLLRIRPNERFFFLSFSFLFRLFVTYSNSNSKFGKAVRKSDEAGKIRYSVYLKCVLYRLSMYFNPFLRTFTYKNGFSLLLIVEEALRTRRQPN